MHTIFTIIKKELRRFFTDPRMLLSMFLPGVLIFVIYTFMGDMVQNVSNPKITEYTVCIDNAPTEFDFLLKVDGWKITINKENLTFEEKIERLKNKEIDAYIIYEEDFYNKMMEYEHDPSNGTVAPQIQAYYNSTSEASMSFYNYYTSGLNQIEASLINKFDINKDLNTNFDVADKSDVTVYIISMMLPFLLMTFLFSGSMAICSESIAGEKERGTIATLLITPIDRKNLAFGKIVSLGITSLASSVVSFLGLTLSLPNLAGSSFDFSSYGLSTFILILLLIFVTVLLFTTLLTIVSTFSKSVKEASSYSAPLMIIVMLVGVTNFMNTSTSTNALFYAIPIYNTMQCFVGLFSLEFEFINILICIISNLIYTAIGVYILSKMFNDERIMFNK